MGATAISAAVLPNPAFVRTATTQPATAQTTAAITAGRGLLLNRPQAAAATASTVRKFSCPTRNTATPRQRISARAIHGTGCAPGGPGAIAKIQVSSTKTRLPPNRNHFTGPDRC